MPLRMEGLQEKNTVLLHTVAKSVSCAGCAEWLVATDCFLPFLWRKIINRKVWTDSSMSCKAEMAENVLYLELLCSFLYAFLSHKDLYLSLHWLEEPKILDSAHKEQNMPICIQNQICAMLSVLFSLETNFNHCHSWQTISFSSKSHQSITYPPQSYRKVMTIL